MAEEKTGIVTQKELEKTAGAKKAPVSKNTEATPTPQEKPKKKKNQAVTFECGFAPLGESNIAFVHKFQGEEFKYSFKLKNKRYTLPADLKDNEKIRWRQALKDNGFVDVTVIESGAKFDKPKGKFIYTVMHPEHTERNRINGTIALAMVNDDGTPVTETEGPNAGKQKTVQVTIIEGLVRTEDAMVYEALLDAGFVGAGQKQKEE